MLHAIRAFFHGRGYIEINTPILTRAPAPEPHIDCFEVGEDYYLIPSPELNMKRLMSETGLERCYQLGPVFRNGERGRFHNPEFVLLEWYGMGCTYVDLMEQVESLISFVLDALSLSGSCCYQGRSLDLTPPYVRMTVREAFLKFAGALPPSPFDGQWFDQAMVELVEPGLATIGKPVFLLDWPGERASLARLKPEDPGVAERVELYAGGVELANGFSELTDPEEQARRFVRANEMRIEMGRPIYPWPEDFLLSLGHLGECAGMAFGIERFLMLLLDKDSIDDVMAFTIEKA